MPYNMPGGTYNSGLGAGYNSDGTVKSPSTTGNTTIGGGLSGGFGVSNGTTNSTGGFGGLDTGGMFGGFGSFGLGGDFSGPPNIGGNSGGFGGFGSAGVGGFGGFGTSSFGGLSGAGEGGFGSDLGGFGGFDTSGLGGLSGGFNDGGTDTGGGFSGVQPATRTGSSFNVASYPTPGFGPLSPLGSTMANPYSSSDVTAAKVGMLSRAFGYPQDQQNTTYGTLGDIVQPRSSTTANYLNAETMPGMINNPAGAFGATSGMPAPDIPRPDTPLNAMMAARGWPNTTGMFPSRGNYQGYPAAAESIVQAGRTGPNSSEMAMNGTLTRGDFTGSLPKDQERLVSIAQNNGTSITAPVSPELMSHLPSNVAANVGNYLKNYTNDQVYSPPEERILSVENVPEGDFGGYNQPEYTPPANITQSAVLGSINEMYNRMPGPETNVAVNWDEPQTAAPAGTEDTGYDYVQTPGGLPGPGDIVAPPGDYTTPATPTTPAKLASIGSIFGNLSPGPLGNDRRGTGSDIAMLHEQENNKPKDDKKPTKDGNKKPHRKPPKRRSPTSWYSPVAMTTVPYRKIVF